MLCYVGMLTGSSHMYLNIVEMALPPLLTNIDKNINK